MIIKLSNEDRIVLEETIRNLEFKLYAMEMSGFHLKVRYEGGFAYPMMDVYNDIHVMKNMLGNVLVGKDIEDVRFFKYMMMEATHVVDREDSKNLLSRLGKWND